MIMKISLFTIFIALTLSSSLLFVSCTNKSTPITRNVHSTEKKQNNHDVASLMNNSNSTSTVTEKTATPLQTRFEKPVIFTPPTIFDEEPPIMEVQVNDVNYTTIDGDRGYEKDEVATSDSNLSVTEQAEQIYQIVDVQPEFPGGYQKLKEYIATNTVYPNNLEDEQLVGKIYLRFVIEKDGSVSNVTILRGMHPLMDKEAIRVIKSMPNWNPARINGEKVASYFTIPFAVHTN
jgi:protein TonB